MKITSIKLPWLAGLAMMSACSKAPPPLNEMVPASATSVAYDQAEGGRAVTFRVDAAPYSYEYLDDFRARLRNSGYTLCRKSAVSKWEKKPADARLGGEFQFWLVELYAAEHFTRFFVVRASATPSVDGGVWQQHFYLAAQEIPEGRQDMVSISKFCD